MRRFAWLLLLGSLWAQTKVTVTGNVQTLTGSTVTSGTVEFVLPSGYFWRVVGTAIVADPTAGKCSINASGNIVALVPAVGPCQVWGNDQLTPANSTYSVNFRPNGVLKTQWTKVLILSPGPYDLTNPTFAPTLSITQSGATIVTNPQHTNVVPDVDNNFTLGTPNFRWGQLWTNNINGINAVGGVATLGSTNLFTGSNTFTGNTIANTTAPLAGLSRILSTGVSSGIQVIGDSTGNETTEWPYLFSTFLLPKLPTTYTVKYWLWNDTIKGYSAPTILQTGTAVSQRTINFTGSINGARLLNSDVPVFSAFNVDLRAQWCLASWRPAVGFNFLSKYTEPFREVRWGITATGTMTIETTPTGSSAQNDIRTSTAAVPDVGANGCQWLRATWNAGSINFYTSTDTRYYTDSTTVWTQVGTTVTSPNTSFYIGPGSDWTYGISTNGTSTGVEIRNGVNGPVLNPRNIDAWVPLDSSTTLTGAPEFNIINGSMPGAGVSYFTGAAVAGFANPNWSQAVIFVSLSHNELGSIGAGEMNSYGQLFKQLTAAIPLGHLVVLTQNPRTAPATNITEQAVRRAELLSWSSPVGYDVIDTYGAFLNDPRWATTPGILVNPADGIHPTNGNNVPGNSEGMKLWESTIESAFNRSINSSGSIYASPNIPLVWPVSQGGTGTTTSTGSGSVVLNNNPIFTGTTTAPSAFLTATRRLQNAIDADNSGVLDIISCGLTVDQNCYTTYRGFAASGVNGAAYFQVGKANNNHYVILDNQSSSMARLDITPNGPANINGVGTSGVQFNNTVGSSGIVRGNSGGATPVQIWTIDATGAIFFSQVGSNNGKIHGTWTASRDFNYPDASGTMALSTAAVTTGRATCWKGTGQIGYCSTQPDATGACTCN